MSITFICWLASFALLILVMLIGLFGGLRKGALRAVVKLLALVLSIVLAVITTICLRGALTEILSGILKNNVLSESMAAQESLITLIAQISAAIVMVLLFWLIFTVVRLLMLIPEKLISSNLPREYEHFEARKKANVDPAALPEVAEADSDNLPEETIAPSEEPVAAKPSTNKKVLWNTGAALCGALSSLLFVSVLLIPLAGFVTRGGNTLYRVTEVLADEGYGDYSDEICDIAKGVSTSPLFSVPDFLLGKVVFEPLTTVPTEYGTISLTKELDIVTELLCKALPAAIHVTENGTLNKEDAKLLSEAVDTVAQSDLLLSVGTLGAGFAGQTLENSEKFGQSESTQALKVELVEILEDMTPQALAEDLGTASQLTGALADSTILKALVNADKNPNPADLTDRKAMRESFGILYDNNHTKSLLIPLINLGTEIVFQSMGAEPVHSNADINDLSREQILIEADRLCDVAENISSFNQSMEGEDTKLADYEMVAAGKALDSLRDSVLFGNQYDKVVKSVTAANGNNQNSALIESLGDALIESESAEKLMNSAQNMAIMSDALEDSTSKGRENEKLVSSLDVLLNDTTPKDANSLSGVAGDHFLDNKENLDNETKKQMLEDSMKALATVCATGSDNVEAEADAVQTFHDLTNSKTNNVFEEVSEKEAVDYFLASQLAMEMLKNLNAENRDYGIRAKLSDENKANIAAALAESTADATQKLIVGQFFGVN